MKNNAILVIIALAMFMEAVDTSIINTAVPVMAEHFHVHPIDLKLTLISYLLSLAVFIPISGWVADKYGIKKIFMIATGIFTLSSLACGLTNTLSWLVISRIMQGIGGALTIPVGRLIIVRHYKRHEIILKMTTVVMISSVGMMLGPLAGGVITHYLSWRWIFWVNIPVGMLILGASYFFLPKIPPYPVHPLDRHGFVLFGAALSLLTLSLSLLSDANISTMHAFIILMGALVLFGMYHVHSRHIAHPIIKSSLLNIRTFRLAISANLLSRMGFGGAPFLLPLLFQICLHYNPYHSGLLLAPIALGVFAVKPFSIIILKHLGYKKLLTINACLISLSLISFALINESTSAAFIATLTFIHGFLIAAQFTAMNSLAYADVPQDLVSNATSIASTIQQLAISFGVAMSAILVKLVSAHLIITILDPLLFHRTFIAMGIVHSFTLFIFFRLKKEDGLALLHEHQEEIEK